MNIGSTFASVIFGVIFLVVGYFVAFTFGAPILENAKASEKWPTTEATIIRSDVERSRSDGKTMYSANVEYKYVVEGEEFINDTIWFGGDYSSSSRSPHQKTIRKYPVKKTVDVHYNPKEPATSVLEPGTSYSSYLVYGVGWLFMIIGGGALLTGLGTIAFGMFAVGMAAQKPGSTSSGGMSSSDDTGMNSSSDVDDDFIENL